VLDAFSGLVSEGLADGDPTARSSALWLLNCLAPIAPVLVFARLLEACEGLQDDGWWETRVQATHLCLTALAIVAEVAAASGEGASGGAGSESKGDDGGGGDGQGRLVAAAAKALEVEVAFVEAVVAVSLQFLTAVVTAEAQPDVVKTFVVGAPAVFGDFPALLQLFAHAIAQLPAAQVGELLGVSPRGEPVSAGASPLMLRSRIAATNHADAPALAAPLPALPLLHTLAGLAQRGVLQKLACQHLQLLLHVCTRTAAETPAPIATARKASLPPTFLQPLTALQDLVVVAMCDAATAPAAVSAFFTVVTTCPGAASMLTAPALVGSLLWLLRSTPRALEVEAAMADMFTRLVACGAPWDRGVGDVLAAVSRRDPRILEGSAFAAVPARTTGGGR
jgi:hypothetical protein